MSQKNSKEIREAAEFLKREVGTEAKIGIILGTGLGGLVGEITIEKSISYSEIPNFPISSVEGHSGRLILGTIGTKKVLAMQGRFHYYEGYTMEQVTLPVRVMKLLGIETLFVSNAAGGLNPTFPVGTIMIINDHINMFGTNPLLGKNMDEFGPRFPAMNDAYSPRLIEKAFEIGKRLNIDLATGVYVGTSGPTYETMAECRMFRTLGGDAVGMSTVPEVIVARHSGLEVFGVSIITNSSMASEVAEANHEEVQKIAAAAEPKMTKIISELVQNI